MDVQIINKKSLSELLDRASENERNRVAFDLRTTSDEGSQRMLNALQPGTVVPIHRHESSSETNICLSGKLDVIFYAEFPNMDAGGAERDFQETFRVSLCPKDGIFGVQIPMGVWHTVLVREKAVIFEGKDGKYNPQK